jgi:hypothetical protein
MTEHVISQAVNIIKRNNQETSNRKKNNTNNRSYSKIISALKAKEKPSNLLNTKELIK